MLWWGEFVVMGVALAILLVMVAAGILQPLDKASAQAGGISSSQLDAVCEADRRALDIMAAKHGQYEMWAAQMIAKQEAQLKALLAQFEALKQAGGAKKETPTP